MSIQPPDRAARRAPESHTAREAGPSELPGADGAPVALLALFDSHPALGDRLRALGNVLLHHGLLSAADRELLILRVAAGRSPYVESGHRPIAICAGLTADEINLACKRPGTDGIALKPRHVALLRACDELLETGALRIQAHSALMHGRDPSELLEVLAVVSFYGLVASITKAFDLQPEPRSGGGEHGERSLPHSPASR